MVDIHSHIVWGVDDGSESLEESLRMLDLAQASGTTDIVATPHASPEYRFCGAVNAARIGEMQVLRPGIRIHAGCDFHITYDNVEDAIANPTKYTIAGRNYLLIEFSELIIFTQTEDILARLREAGITSIVTHPERNRLLQRQAARLEEWVKSGTLVQITAASLTGRFGKSAQAFSGQLIRDGLAHFIASDAHDTKDRTPSMAAVFDTVAAQYGAEVAERLFVENPAAVIAGEPIEPAPAAPRRRWFSFGW